MGTKKSVRHHFVPKSILKRFCFRGQTTFYATKRSKGIAVERRNIETIFTRRHYNSFLKSDGSKDDTIEKFFAYELDNYIPEGISVFDNAIETGEIVFRSAAPRWRFVQFFFNHMKRSPDFIEPIVNEVGNKTFHPNLLEEAERDLGPLSESDREKLMDRKFRETVVTNSRVQNIGQQSSKILDTLNSLQILVSTPSRPNKKFICSSNPVARFEDYPNQPLGEKGVELWTTLTPRIAVGFVKVRAQEKVIPLEDNLVRKINLTLAKQSSAICSSSHELIASLSKAAW